MADNQLQGSGLFNTRDIMVCSYVGIFVIKPLQRNSINIERFNQISYCGVCHSSQQNCQQSCSGDDTTGVQFIDHGHFILEGLAVTTVATSIVRIRQPLATLNSPRSTYQPKYRDGTVYGEGASTLFVILADLR